MTWNFLRAGILASEMRLTKMGKRTMSAILYCNEWRLKAHNLPKFWILFLGLVANFTGDNFTVTSSPCDEITSNRLKLVDSSLHTGIMFHSAHKTCNSVSLFTIYWFRLWNLVVCQASSYNVKFHLIVRVVCLCRMLWSP